MVQLVKSKQHLIYELQQELWPLAQCMMVEDSGKACELPVGYNNMQHVIDEAARLQSKIHALQSPGFEVDPIALAIEKELTHG